MASMAKLTRYSLGDFQSIKDDGFNYSLSPDIIKIIQSIAEEVGSPEYVKTPIFEKRLERGVGNSTAVIPSSGSNGGFVRKGNAQGHYQGHNQGHNQSHHQGHNQGHNQGHRSNHKYKNAEVTDEDWDIVRNYQPTVMVKRQGIESHIDAIRKHLNKITDKTYDSIKDQVFDEIESIILALSVNLSKKKTLTFTEEQLTELNKVGSALFNIASGNSFYSEVYARLYKELLSKYDFMQEVTTSNFKALDSMFNDFRYCDPNTNYDEFCENNKLNERRRALSLFYLNLMKQEVIDADEITRIIVNLQQLLKQKMAEANNKNIVDELSEVIAVFITNGANELSEVDEQWPNIVAELKRVSALKTSGYQSLTNKTIFKHLDIIEKNFFRF